MACGPPRFATSSGSRSRCPRAACMFTASRTAFPACIRSAVTRCGRFASSGAITLERLMCSFPSAAGQSAPSVSTVLSSASARLPRCHSRSTHTCCAMPVVLSSPMMATTHGLCSTTSGTRTSSTRSATPKWRPTGSGTFGVDRCRRRQARRRFPLYHLGICRRIPLGDHLLNQLNTALDLLGCHRSDAAGMLQLHLPRHQQGAYLHVGRRLLLTHLCNGFRPMTLEVGSEREQEILVERSTCSLPSQ